MNIYFKENLILIRRSRDITQEKLGELCGVSRQAVTKWESGESLPDLYKLDEICEVLGVTIQDLIYKKVNSQDDDELKRDVKAIYKLIKDGYEGKTSSCLYEEYLQTRDQDNADEQGHELMLEGIKAIEMLETDRAYELFEKALVRGITSAGIELLRLFVDWYECQDTLEERIDFEVFCGKSIQAYGKILVEENKRKHGVTGSEYIL